MVNSGTNNRRLPLPLGGAGGPWAGPVAAAVAAGLGRRVGRLAGFAPNGVVATHHVIKGGCILVALTLVLTGGAGVDRIPGDAMLETIVGEERTSRDGGRWRLASPSHVGIVLGGDSGLRMVSG